MIKFGSLLLVLTGLAIIAVGLVNPALMESLTDGEALGKWGTVGVGGACVAAAALLAGLEAVFSRALRDSFGGEHLEALRDQIQHEKDRARRLRTSGAAGRASIVQMRDLETTINDNPLAELVLAVTVGERPPYQITVQSVVPQAAVGRLTAGQPVPVKVDPVDPSTLVIEWEQP